MFAIAVQVLTLVAGRHILCFQTQDAAVVHYLMELIHMSGGIGQVPSMHGTPCCVIHFNTVDSASFLACLCKERITAAVV